MFPVQHTELLKTRINALEMHVEAFNIAHNLIDFAPIDAYRLFSYIDLLVKRKNFELNDITEMLLNATVDPT